ncbi:hypothetical protein ACQPXT_13470 [Streptomyces sp. CA-100214]
MALTAFHLSGAPVVVGDELTVDHNYPVEFVAAVDSRRIRIRWGWGAEEDITATRAAVTVDRT